MWSVATPAAMENRAETEEEMQCPACTAPGTHEHMYWC